MSKHWPETKKNELTQKLSTSCQMDARKRKKATTHAHAHKCCEYCYTKLTRHAKKANASFAIVLV